MGQCISIGYDMALSQFDASCVGPTLTTDWSRGEMYNWALRCLDLGPDQKRQHFSRSECDFTRIVILRNITTFQSTHLLLILDGHDSMIGPEA